MTTILSEAFTEALKALIDYNWKDEAKSFMEDNDTEIHDVKLLYISTHDLDAWISWCKNNDCTDHIFYHLMVLRRATIHCN